MKQRLLAGALGFYAVWTLATWMFEGRIDTLLRPEAVGDRIIYAFAVNLLLGLGGGIALIRFWRQHEWLEAATSGFGSRLRALAGIAAGLVLGLGAYFLQGAPSTDPVIIVNAFSQVFVVSAAEVVVCWSLVGAAIKARLGGRGVSTLVAAVVASALFGVYHFAHSAPFNSPQMVTLLSVIGLATSAFFFISRDVAGAVVFHNFLGTFGVVQALSAADALAPLERLQIPLLITAGVAAAMLAVGYAILGRTGSHHLSLPMRGSSA